jgi:hypothetical protein
MLASSVQLAQALMVMESQRMTSFLHPMHGILLAIDMLCMAKQ